MDAAELGELEAFRDLFAVAPDRFGAPPELESWLGRCGFASGYGWTRFSRAVGAPRPARTELRVERVERGAVFTETAVRGYGIPAFFREWLMLLPGRERWQCFVAFAGALFTAGEVGWLGIAGTIPEHRGKGAQSALLAARIEAAAAAGCKVVTTETGAPRDGQRGASYRNIVRAGFEPRYVRANYLSSPEDTSGT